MYPLSFLSAPISGFLPLSKAAKCVRIIWEVFSILLSILASIPYTYSGSLAQALQAIRLCLQFGPSWSGWTIIMKSTKKPYLIWADVSGSLMLIFFPCPSWRPKYFNMKSTWSDISIVCPQKSKILLSPFPHGFSTVLPCQQNGHTGIRHLWCILLPLLKWPALLSFKTCDFCLWTHRFQSSLESDMNICSVPVFQLHQKRMRFFQSLLGSF